MTSKMERFVNEEDNNVYDEVTSVGFVNPTYTSHAEAAPEFEKPPIDGINNGHVAGNQNVSSQRVVRTPEIVVPQIGNDFQSEKEIRKWKNLLVIVSVIALLIITALLAALIVVFLKNRECSSQPREPITSPVVGEIGPDGKCFCDPTACGQVLGDDLPTYKPKPDKPMPPKSAEILLGCYPGIGKDGKSMVNDLCWVNETTLYAIQLDGERVLKLDINLDTKTCHVKVIDKDFKPRRVTCAPDGDVYVSIPTSGYIKIYHADGTTSNWTMAEVAAPRNIAIGDNVMVVDHNGTSPFTVYDLNKKYIQTMVVANNENEILYTHMTDGGDFIATGHLTHELYIHNVLANSSKAVAGYGTDDGLFDSPGDLVDSPGGYILICDWKNHRVSVFNKEGEYVSHIRFTHGTHHQPNALSYLVREGNKPDVMAVAPFPASIIWLYTMDYY